MVKEFFNDFFETIYLETFLGLKKLSSSFFGKVSDFFERCLKTNPSFMKEFFNYFLTQSFCVFLLKII